MVSHGGLQTHQVSQPPVPPGREGNQLAAKAGNNAVSKQPCIKKLSQVSCYVAVDSHLAERKGSSNSIFGVTGERPAGRKLAQDIASLCSHLDGEDYAVFSFFPTMGGSAVEVFMEVEETKPTGRAYYKRYRLSPRKSSTSPWQQATV